MKTLSRMTRLEISLVIFMCALFVGAQLYISFHSLISPDTFWTVHTLYHQYSVSLPYRDFMPYKTVLGYYILSIPLLFVHDPFYVIAAVKSTIALCNGIFSLLAAVVLTRLFPKKAVFVALFLLLTATMFLRSAEDVRTDLFAYWFSFFATVCLLNKRYQWAGLILGLAFCFSQKAVWFLVACNVSWLVVWAIYDRSLGAWRQVGMFNLLFASMVSSYVGVWAIFSDIHTVFYSVFQEARLIYQIDLYPKQIFAELPKVLPPSVVYALAWLVSVLSFVVVSPNKEEEKRRLFIFIHTTTIFILLGIYGQFFGYAPTIIFLPLLLLYSAFFFLAN